MRPHVVAYLDVDQEMYHTSYVYTGLALLAQTGDISLDLRTPTPGDWRKAVPGDACIHLTLTADDAGTRSLCIDLWDKSSRFSDAGLQGCDIYYKRSYFQPDAHSLALNLRKKVKPFGLNYSCSVASTLAPLLWAGLRQWPPAELFRLIRETYDYSALRRPEAFLWPPSSPKEPIVLFQTRVWEEHEVVGDDSHAINAERVALVRALRAEFGARFIGGLVPNALARRAYPDAVTNLQSDPRSYTKLNRKALIGIYTRGLHYSTAWKLGEYFAASMCVVGEPIRNTLPHPIRDRVQFLECAGPDAFVSSCHDILRNPEMQWALRTAGFDYFRKWVDPAAHMAWCLQDTIAPAA